MCIYIYYMYYRNGLNLWYPSYLGETNIPKSGFKSDGQAIGQAAKHSSVREINDRKGYLAFKHRRALGSYGTSWEIMVFWNVLIQRNWMNMVVIQLYTDIIMLWWSWNI